MFPSIVLVAGCDSTCVSDWSVESLSSNCLPQLYCVVLFPSHWCYCINYLMRELLRGHPYCYLSRSYYSVINLGANIPESTKSSGRRERIQDLYNSTSTEQWILQLGCKHESRKNSHSVAKEAYTFLNLYEKVKLLPQLQTNERAERNKRTGGARNIWMDNIYFELEMLEQIKQKSISG